MKIILSDSLEAYPYGQRGKGRSRATHVDNLLIDTGV